MQTTREVIGSERSDAGWIEKATFALYSAAESFRQIAEKELQHGDKNGALSADTMAMFLENIAKQAPSGQT